MSPELACPRNSPGTHLDNIVVSIQEGRRGLGAVTARYSSLIRCAKCRVAFLDGALARHPRTTGSADGTPPACRCECAKWGMCPAIPPSWLCIDAMATTGRER
jgi:hypothetical protein